MTLRIAVLETVRCQGGPKAANEMAAWLQYHADVLQSANQCFQFFEFHLAFGEDLPEFLRPGFVFVLGEGR